MQNCLELQKIRWYSLHKSDVDSVIRNTITKMQKDDYHALKKQKLFRYAQCDPEWETRAC